MRISLEEDKLEALRRPFSFYEEYVAKIDYNDYTEPPHIRELCLKLEALCRGEYNNLCVAMPPRHSKSSMITLAFPMWLIINDPSLNILIVNAESSLSEKFGIELRDYLTDYSLLTGKYVSDVKHSSTHLKFEDAYGNLYKGSIKLVGASGGITGQDADYIIIDDPYKGFEDITPGLLDKKIEWFKTKIIQRREPHTKLIICHTRWHSNDLQGYLKENNPNEYEFIEFPAIKADGTPLWKERFSIEFLKQQLEEMGERLFSSIYQQKPLDSSGAFFNLDNLLFGEFTSHEASLNVRSWDLAYSDESKGDINDYTASCKMYKTPDGKYYITNVTMEQYGDRLNNVLKRTAYLDSQNTPIIIETGTKGGASKFYFKDLRDIYLKGYRVTQSEPIGSKVDRATPFKDAILDGKIILDLDERQTDILLKQLQGFPLAKHDDLIDACSYAYNFLQDKTPRVMKPRTHKRKRVKLP